MTCKACRRWPKKVPYGSKRVLVWCDGCDANLVDDVSKRSERQKAKRAIEKQLAEEENDRIEKLAEREGFKRKLGL